MTDQNMKILTVDDFSTMRRIIRNMLRQLGYNNIVEAEDGAEALSLLQREKVDFVISDWNMPNMSGLDLLKAIRADDNLKPLPVLLVTAEALKENVVEALKAGVNNYVVKPFTAETLKRASDSFSKKMDMRSAHESSLVREAWL
jgi:two-component system, chemotaxis family, chemotaxis protein CheY